jgi:hypothetical protein
MLAPNLAAPAPVAPARPPPTPEPDDNDPVVGWNPYAMNERPVGHAILRIDLGFGSGTDGMAGRVAPGIEYRPLQDWGIGFSLAAYGAGINRPRLRGEIDGDFRTFLDFGLPRGWLRTQLSGGPILYGKTGYVCTTPLCGYLTSEPPTFGAFGSAEVGYWLQRGPAAFGGGVRAQLDTSGALVFSANLGLSGDIAAGGSGWR